MFENISKMFENIGQKIKTLAVVIFVVCAVLFVILGIITLFVNFLVGILCISLGPLFSWISCWLLYGFGEIIEAVDDIRSNTYKINKELQTFSQQMQSVPTYSQLTEQPTQKETSKSAEKINTWTCSKCGKKNESTFNYCNSCGMQRYRASSTSFSQQKPKSIKTTWICPDCGQENRSNDIWCKGCGRYK